MSWHTLFQSGMGSLDAPRTEERSTTRADMARSGFYAVTPAAPMRPVKALRLPSIFLTRYRDRGNSAKALSHRRTRTTIP